MHGFLMCDLLSGRTPLDLAEAGGDACAHIVDWFVQLDKAHKAK